MPTRRLGGGKATRYSCLAADFLDGRGIYLWRDAAVQSVDIAERRSRWPKKRDAVLNRAPSSTFFGKLSPCRGRHWCWCPASEFPCRRRPSNPEDGREGKEVDS